MISSTNKNIRAIVFDYGGVIELYGVGSLSTNIAQLLGISRTDYQHEYFKHNYLANVENLRYEDMVLEVVSKFTSDKKIKDKVLSLMKEEKSQRRINTDLLALFPTLKHQELKIGIFSNATSELRERLNISGIAKMVDEVVISGEIGFQKPHKEAFDVLFEKLKVLPEELVFVDDAPKSLEKAGEIGYIPILFKNNDQLKADLKNLGIATG